MNYNQAIELFSKLRINGGFSVKADSLEEPTRGFMVSLQGCEAVYNLAALDAKELLFYTISHAARLKRHNAFFGGWLDGGKVYLDISVNIKSRAAALELAAKNNQLAIYDLESEDSIYLEELQPVQKREEVYI